MSIYGEQWVCLCGWHNVFLRKNCRNCYAPREVATTRTEGPMERMVREVLDRPSPSNEENNG